MKDTNRVFISYAWDDNREWVLALAKRLRSDGVDIVLDQWATVPGDMLPKFMESAVRDSDYVLVICTPKYKKKSDERAGGVGYEGDIMTAEVFALEKRGKFIPLLFEGDWRLSSPSWLLGAFYLDFRVKSDSNVMYDELLELLLGRRKGAPELGTAPPAWAELRPIETVQIPLSAELPQFSKDGWITLMIQALANTFGDKAVSTRFVGLFSTQTYNDSGNDIVVVSLVAPYFSFLKYFKDALTSLIQFAIDKDREGMEKILSKSADKFSEWRYKIDISPKGFWTAHQFEVNPDIKLIEIAPIIVDAKQKKFWRPKTTSEVLKLISHLSTPPAAQIVLDGMLEDARLVDLTKDLLDYGYVELSRLHVASSNPEQWDYSGDEDT